MARKRERNFPPLIPAPDYAALHTRMQEMGFTVMSYQNRHEGGYWIPQHVAAPDLALILWCEAGTGNYAIAGWEPQLGPHHHGGRRDRLDSALNWIQRARDVRDGKASDFLGV